MRALLLMAVCLIPPAVASAAAISAPPTSGSPLEAQLYHYRAAVTDVIDGDTIVVDIDLGFHTWIHEEHIRLYGINAPEKKDPGGAEATQFLRDKIQGKRIILQTIKGPKDVDKQEKYGRYLGIVWLGTVNVNELLVTTGHAVLYDGEGPRP